MYWLVARYAAVLALGVLVGWVINGWRLNANIASLKASQAEEVSRYYQAARKAEKGLIESSDRLRKDRDDKVKNLNSRLESVTAELQQRKKRDSREPTNTSSCSGATGAELSREDAEFLTRIAAEADKVVENLNYCINQYEQVRKIK